MGKTKKALVILRGGGQYVVYDITDTPVLMDEKYLRRDYPEIGRYTDAHKREVLDETLDKMEVRRIKIPSFLPNAKRKICLPWGNQREPGKEDFTKGVCGLFEIAEIWENPFPGFWLISSTLTAMRCDSLRCAGPDTLFYVTEIKGASQELADLLTQLVYAAVPKKRWKKEEKKGKWRASITTRRNAVLDYRAQDSSFPFNSREFAEVTVKLKKREHIRLTAFYEDTVCAVIGANSGQLREVLPLMGNAYAYLINCPKPDSLNASVLKVSEMDIVLTAKIQAVKKSAPYIAALLRWWWNLERSDAERWAAEILRKAKEHLSKPNGDYVSISPNPAKLRHAVQYEVTLDFLENAVKRKFLSLEEAEKYRNALKNAFYPEPVVTELRKRMEDPDVFPYLMRSIVQEKSTFIVAQEERFVKTEKKFGALRRIGKSLYLVMPEEQWANAYKKAAKNAGLETSFAQSDGWERRLQAILVNAGLIKYTSGNPRYRYDLYGNGKKDNTYVVAVPWDDVKPQE